MGIRGDNIVWQTPKTNWDTHPKAIEPSDMNRIEGNILAVREQISIPLRVEVVDNFPPHTAGRIIYHTGNNKAYVSNGTEWLPIGIEGNAEAGHVLAGKTFSSQVAGAGAVGTLTLTGNATAEDILENKTCYTTDPKNQVIGSMPNRGAVIITPGTSKKAIPEGYHNGNGYVSGVSIQHNIGKKRASISEGAAISINITTYGYGYLWGGTISSVTGIDMTGKIGGVVVFSGRYSDKTEGRFHHGLRSGVTGSVTFSIVNDADTSRVMVVGGIGFGI